MVSASAVRDLRERTGAGMMDCKKALAETGGDFEKAVDLLRQKGLAALAKKAGRIAAEGLTAVRVAPDGKAGAVVEVNCETDFVAKNDDFKAFVGALAEVVLFERPATCDDLLVGPALRGGQTVDETVKELVAKIGEKIEVRRFTRFEGEAVSSYVHGGGRIGVLVEGKGSAGASALEALRDVAMHVAAVRPRYVRREEVPAETLEREREIYRAQGKESGKPEAIVEKMVAGRLEKFYSEVCLLDQVFVKDPDGKQTVGAFLKKTAPGLSVVRFARFEVGEGIEKRSEDFAAEVMSQVKPV
ncbi:MAG: translation elongation factor Ts [Nitrospirae bacterium RBG_16_64_22]|nr:MAG: translation elongation factor Ts [Nitrospirae bacterium RBG_16_64_22]